jgi:hypothetical protein
MKVAAESRRARACERVNKHTFISERQPLGLGDHHSNSMWRRFLHLPTLPNSLTSTSRRHRFLNLPLAKNRHDDLPAGRFHGEEIRGLLP